MPQTRGRWRRGGAPGKYRSKRKREMILFTSDWQLSYANLDRMSEVVAEIFRFRKGFPFDTLIHLGDVKHAMNPVDVRVVNWTVETINRFRSDGVAVYFLLGNHDKTALHDDSPHWFPALGEAGAVCVDRPAVHSIDSTPFYFVPYFQNRATFRNAVAAAAKKSRLRKKKGFLCFHQMIRGAVLRVGSSGVIADGEGDATLGELRADDFRACIGGHVHKPQLIGKTSNAYYVGSPVAQDWGEVNQEKGYLYMGRNRDLKRLPSKLPGWYDPDLPEFPRMRKSWKGATIRLHVPVSGTNSSTELTRARAQAEAKYSGASLHIVPSVIADDAQAAIDPEQVSADIVASYVKDTAPPKFPESKVIKYISGKLQEAEADIRNIRGVRFRSAVGENVLSFRRVEADYSSEGITVVSGENRDWQKSNGSGKTNYLQLLALALFGRTRKGQKADAWVNDQFPKKKAFVELQLQLPDGQEMSVYRQRNPQKLEVRLGGELVASGQSAQRDIEHLTGLTWDLMTSVIYLDQSEGNVLVDGTDAERKALIFQVLQLEKYAVARKLVGTDIQSAEDKAHEAEYKAAQLAKQEESFRELTEDVEQDRIDAAAVRKTLRKLRSNVAALEAVRARLRTKNADAARRVADAKPERDQAMRAAAQAESALSLAEKELGRVAALPAQCSKCGQDIPEKYKEHCVAELQTKADKKKASVVRARKRLRKIDAETTAAERDRDEVLKELNEVSSQLYTLNSDLVQNTEKLERAKEQQKRTSALLEKLDKASREAKLWRAKETKLRNSLVIFRYCQKALGKDGIPAYLTANLCPRLSAAAATYSELFADGAITVDFVIDERQDLDIQVANKYGGDGLLAQSRGESSVVSLIVGFALRDVTSPASMLIADEPGDGLDERRAQLFADGLREIGERFRAVWITTHNATILAALSDVRQVRVIKEGRISKIECDE